MTQVFSCIQFQWSAIDAHVDENDEVVKFQVRSFGAQLLWVAYRPENLCVSPSLLAEHYQSLTLMRASETVDDYHGMKEIAEIDRLKKTIRGNCLQIPYHRLSIDGELGYTWRFL